MVYPCSTRSLNSWHQVLLVHIEQEPSGIEIKTWSFGDDKIGRMLIVLYDTPDQINWRVLHGTNWMTLGRTCRHG